MAGDFKLLKMTSLLRLLLICGSPSAMVYFFWAWSQNIGGARAHPGPPLATPLVVMANQICFAEKSQTEKKMIELTYLRMSLWFCMALRFCSLNLDFLSLFWTMASSLVGALVGM